MKNTRQDKYPHSATLFRFCKRALEMRYAGNVKVIDQDVGSILGYDPADCSHWKKGKKNIKTLGILKSIADHLSIDERLLIGITSGHIRLDEALFEYKGYGDFSFSNTNLENLKKDYFKYPDKWSQGGFGEGKSFEDLFKINSSALSSLVKDILEKIRPFSLPLSVSKVYDLFDSASLELLESKEADYKVEYYSGEGRKKNLKFSMPSSQPSFMKFLALKELYKHLCLTKDQAIKEYVEFPEEVIEIESNLFAGLILVPELELKNRMSELDISQDFIKQLAENFAVSLALMNKRLGYFINN
jgi:hypothetical protein